tara:strand:+ start:63 stop:395 length:333 start_codon:yes stop_codon:yes gene_type:complete
MSDDWILGVLAALACATLWCMLWCCAARVQQLPNAPNDDKTQQHKSYGVRTGETFKYNPVLRSPPPSPTVHNGPETDACVVADVNAAAVPVTESRTLPGLHFINSFNIQD